MIELQKIDCMVATEEGAGKSFKQLLELSLPSVAKEREKSVEKAEKLLDTEMKKVYNVQSLLKPKGLIRRRKVAG